MKYASLLTPRTQEMIDFWREHRRRSKPPFPFQNLPDSPRLAYEVMTETNADIYFDLFIDDPHPFVDERFKTPTGVADYVAYLLEYHRYSFKHGGCDWFLRLKEPENEYIGVLHLYELNKEWFNGEHPPCFFGYAVREPYRRQGYATEAAWHLLSLIPTLFNRAEVMAEPDLQNEASRNLLSKLGFEEQRLLKNSSFWYKKLSDELLEQDEYW